jgi:hypothetical protein
MHGFMYVKTVVTIKGRRLEDAGDPVRMFDDRTVKKAFLGKRDGRRKAVIPEFRWLDCIENELTLMSAKRWTKKAEEEICMGYYSIGGTGKTVRTVF